MRTDPDGTALIYIDRHLVHEVTSPQAFEGLDLAGRKVFRIGANLAVSDHNVPTTERDRPIADPISRLQVDTLDANCDRHGIRQFKMNDRRQGIVHVIGPEQGATLPGMTVVCGDSHTSTHGAFAALAHGIGTSEVEHVLATQCLTAKKAKNLKVQVNGHLAPGVTAKDLVLAIIGRMGTAGGTGYTLEFAGEGIEALTMEGRMTVCNMAIEAGARAGLVGVDDTTIDYLKGRPLSPQGDEWEQAVAYWRTLRSDQGATLMRWSRSMRRRLHHKSAGAPVLRWCCPSTPSRQTPAASTTRSSATPCSALWVIWVYSRTKSWPALRPTRCSLVPAPTAASKTFAKRQRWCSALADVWPRHQTRAGGAWLWAGQGTGRGRRPGCRLQAAGFEWREPGCSMCLAMNADRLDRVSAAPAPATATLKAAKALVAAPIWSAQQWRQPLP